MRDVDLTLSSEATCTQWQDNVETIGDDTGAVDDQNILCASFCPKHSTVFAVTAFCFVEPYWFLPQHLPESRLRMHR